jgi:16S rRNA (guanine966-N2)-methyltransferase
VGIAHCGSQNLTLMRITGGVARGIPLQTVQYSGFRPAMDRVRQALFSSLQSYGELTGISVLDLFAGSGAYGLEALSRGASHVVWVEKDRRSLDCLRKNLQAVTKSSPRLDAARCRIAAGDVLSWQPGGEQYDLILCDPPYETGVNQMEALWDALKGWLKPDCRFGVCWETPAENVSQIPADWQLVRQLGSKGPAMLFMRPA